MVETATLMYSGLGIVLILFHLGLAAGAPWGKLTMGGFYEGVLPTKLRITAVLQALLIAITIIIVLAKADPWLSDFRLFADTGIWFVVALFAISTVLNLITHSVWERRMGVPIAGGMFVSSLIIALL